MFCPKCQTENADNASYCWKCWAELHPKSDSAAVNDPNRAVHPYHTLGGWLALFAYGFLIGAVLLAISAVLDVAALVRLASYLGNTLLLLGLLEIILYIPYLYLSWKMFRMIKAKNPLFLRTYEKIMILLAGIDVVIILTLVSRSSAVPSDGIRSLMSAVIVFAIWLTYFRKSIRVRTYFGSDAYLRESIFLKGCSAPNPAD